MSEVPLRVQLGLRPLHSFPFSSRDVSQLRRVAVFFPWINHNTWQQPVVSVTSLTVTRPWVFSISSYKLASNTWRVDFDSSFSPSAKRFLSSCPPWPGEWGGGRGGNASSSCGSSMFPGGKVKPVSAPISVKTNNFTFIWLLFGWLQNYLVLFSGRI